MIYRHVEEPEKIRHFRAHSGQCHYCPDGIVKMSRSMATYLLEPNNMHCLKCGQRYFYKNRKMSVAEIKDLDVIFWRQKGDDEEDS